MSQQILDDGLAKNNLAAILEKDLASMSPASVKVAEAEFSRFKRSFSGHKDYMEAAKRYNDFYLGTQWVETDLAKLKSEGRPALTINLILSVINTLCGEQSNRRVDVQFKPRKDTNQESANAMSKLAMAISDSNDLDYVESEVFEDGLIMERGYFDVRMGFDDDMRGDVEITSLHPMEVIPDAQMRDYDPRKWNEVTLTRWLSLDVIATTYGKKAAALLKTSVSVTGALDNDSIRFEDFDEIDTLNDDMDDFVSQASTGAGVDEDRRQIKTIRIVERQFFKLHESFALVNPENGRKRFLPAETSTAEAKLLGEQFGWYVHRETKRRVYWRVTADRVVLHDDWSPYRSFTVLPYFPYFRRGKPMGIVRNLISPQEQYNKLSSQELHIVNSTANGGYIVEEGALVGMTMDQLEKNGSKTGLVIAVAPGKIGAVQKIQPNQIPTGVIQAKQSAEASLGRISSLSDAYMGGNSAEVSGVALKNKEDRGQVQIQKPMDNLQRTRALLFRKVRELVQDFYTDERVIMMTDEFSPGQDSTQMVINERGENGEVNNDIVTGDMDIILTTKPNRANYNDHQFAQVINLRQAGVMIPDEWVVRYSDLNKKDELAQAMASANQPSEEQAAFNQQQMIFALKGMDADVQKTMASVMLMQAQAQFQGKKAETEALAPSFRQAEQDLQLQEIIQSTKTRERLAQIQGIQTLDKESIKQRGDILKEQIKAQNPKSGA